MSAQTPKVDEREARRVAEAARETEWQHPSFAKELFLGKLRLNLVHPHPRQSPEDQARERQFLDRLETFLRDHVDAGQIERDAKIPDHVIEGLAKIGAFGMKIPERYGGLGLSVRSYCRALELVGSVSASLIALLSAHQSIGVPQPLKLFGTEEQKQRYLPRTATTAVSAFALTEPDVGSDPARMHMTATPTDDGSAYILDGVKLWTTNGTIAELLVVMARVPSGPDRRGGISAFIVEAGSAGLSVDQRCEFMGLRGIENGVLRFDGVRVPAENLLGKEGQGLKIALTTLNTGRLSLPAACAASAKWCLAVVREWAGDREQWGQPIGRHEAVAAKISEIASYAFALEAVVELSAALADDEPHDIRIEAAIAKLYSSEIAWRIADETLQIRGGRGFETADSLAERGEPAIPVEQVLRDLRINRIFEGSSEIMKLLIAREAVDTHLQVAGDIIEPDVALGGKLKAAGRAGLFYGRWLPTLITGKGQLPGAYGEFGPLARHVRFIERASRKLARATFLAMSRYQAKLERKQALLGRVVDIGAELYAMTAVCVHAQMRAAEDMDGATESVELADLFCRNARRRVAVLFDAIFANDDERNYRAAQDVLAGRHRWLETGIIAPEAARAPEEPPAAPAPAPDPTERMAGTG